MKDKLKPCPFCKGLRLFFDEDELFCFFAVVCIDCDARGPEAETRAEAADKWDTRQEEHNK